MAKTPSEAVDALLRRYEARSKWTPRNARAAVECLFRAVKGDGKLYRAAKPRLLALMPKALRQDAGHTRDPDDDHFSSGPSDWYVGQNGELCI